MTNPTELEKLNTDSFQTKVAQGITQGVVNVFKQFPKFSIKLLTNEYKINIIKLEIDIGLPMFQVIN